ncbi:MAG TPA: alpha/beta hydrolase domain-containing protein [Candidatus Acidoferrales bacterium]|nr:alpha/beta hydrolase domain-containing protein [Candidatus Acidoferrales bacterium]
MSRNQIRIELTSKTPFAGGKSFGNTGPYERLTGKASFAIDPDEKDLPFICDLDLAPRNSAGLVEFAAVLDIVKPVDLSRGNRRLLLDFSNRGNRGAFTRLNDGGGPDLSKESYAGNGFLNRLGYTVVWCGWQGDLVFNGNNVVAFLPEARQNGQPLRGKVRQEFIVDRPGVLSLPVSGNANIQCYPVLDRAAATLTMREKEADPRVAVPAGEWDLARAEVKDGRLVVTPSNVDLYLKEGFRPGWIYELIYETEGSRVMGLGFLGVRDAVSFLRYGAKDANGVANPLAGAIDKAYAYGASLAGRVVREYIYEGWNRDASGRKIFDAVLTHTGIGRLFHNMRFAQVGRYPRQHEEHSYPAERYPFNFTPIPDPFTGKVDSVLKRPDSDPLVIHVHTSSEYWERHGSLTHTDPRDGSDVEPPENVRMYCLAGSPHAAIAANNPRWIGQLPPNNMSPQPFLRACFTLMDRWATHGEPPPPSRVPRRSDGTLVWPEEALKRFPKIPGVNLPRGVSRLPYWNYGPDFDRGIMSVFPPEAVPGKEYPLQVPQVDADGNDLGGVRYPDLAAPVATYLGWALRKAGFAEGELLMTNGCIIPFARTKAEREAKGDPRLSIEERYRNHEAYVDAVKRAVEELVKERLMLEEDGARYIEAARAKNPFDPAVPLEPLVTAGRED